MDRMTPAAVRPFCSKTRARTARRPQADPSPAARAGSGREPHSAAFARGIRGAADRRRTDCRALDLAGRRTWRPPPRSVPRRCGIDLVTVRFLIIHPGFLGDALFLGPGIRALKSRWPVSWIGVCLTPRGAAVGQLLPGCDEVLVYDKRGVDRGLRGLLRIGRKLRAFQPDVALISHRSLRSGVLGWLSQASRRVGDPPLCTAPPAFPPDRPVPYPLLNR